MTELLVVHRDCNEAPAFRRGFFVIDQATLAIVAGPLETIAEAEEAAGQARLAARYRTDVSVR
jgi:hypothetical protein